MPSPVRVLRARDRHIVNTFSYGIDPTLARRVHAGGDGLDWLHRQLRPSRVSDQPGAGLESWFPTLNHSPLALWKRDQRDITKGYEVMQDLGRWTLMRRMYSNRQLQEVMTDFWSNLLHVPIGDDQAWVYRVAYDAMIRRHCLGTFASLLVASTTHPAMGIFLDNAVSTKDKPNENLGRELLELHTVGLGAHYTEKDVKNSSRILTGYRVDVGGTYEARYDPAVHDTGRIKVLGFKHPNHSADGRAATVAYLRYLAHHPKTARRIAKRLCIRFVHDEPSADLVRHVAHAYRHSGTDIRATLKALVRHPEFARARGDKVKAPVEDYVSTVRALQIKARKPVDKDSFANAALWQVQGMGQSPYAWPAPNGYPEVDGPWSGVGRVLNSFDTHLALAGGWWPSKQVHHQAHTAWLPALPARFDTVVDHMSRLVLGRPSTDRLEAAASARVGIKLHKKVTAADLAEWRVIPMLATLLDTPAHMTR